MQKVIQIGGFDFVFGKGPVCPKGREQKIEGEEDTDSESAEERFPPGEPPPGQPKESPVSHEGHVISTLVRTAGMPYQDNKTAILRLTFFNGT